MSNPYLPPSFDPKQFQDQVYAAPPPGHVGAGGYGWVSQVRVVSVLNCVQGGLEICVGLFFVGIGFAAPFILELDAANNPGAKPMPAEARWIMPLVYGGLGSPVLLAGLLRIYAGIQNYRFRGRILGITSYILGMASIFVCYCAPTGIAVLIYGLIVQLNPAVVAAFEMGKQGMTGDAILASFASPYFPPPPAGNPPAQA
jgi:hypothetical protein